MNREQSTVKNSELDVEECFHHITVAPPSRSPELSCRVVECSDSRL